MKIENFLTNKRAGRQKTPFVIFVVSHHKMWIKKGVKLIEETPGDGTPVRRQAIYVLAIRITLNKGDIIKSANRCLSHTIDDNLKLHDDGFFESRIRIDRENLIDGIFYAVDGMKVGGYRKVAISPHLAYREKGIPGVIPENAKVIAELKVLRKCE